MLIAAILFAVAAHAPVVGPEIASTPVAVVRAPKIAGPAAPLATDGDGFVLAFSAYDDLGRARTTVMRLDAQAQAVPGTARQLPVTQPYYDAVQPSVSAAANGFFVAQTEVAPLSARVVVWHLDRTLKPDATPFSVIPIDINPNAILLPPGIVRAAGDRVFVVTSNVVAEYDLGGTLRQTTTARFAADDATIAGGALITAGVNSAASYTPCWFFGCGPAVPQHFDVLLSFDGTYPIAATYPFYSDDRVGVATDGSTLLYVFDRYGGPMSFLRFDATNRGIVDQQPMTLGAFDVLPGDPAQRPSAAFDGTRFVAVWRTVLNGTQHAIGAAAIDRDGTVTPIAIPNLADETAPFVVAAGPNRFLVSYLSNRIGGLRLAGRFITFGGRRPVAGR